MVVCCEERAGRRWSGIFRIDQAYFESGSGSGEEDEALQDNVSTGDED